MLIIIAIFVVISCAVMNIIAYNKKKNGSIWKTTSKKPNIVFTAVFSTILILVGVLGLSPVFISFLNSFKQLDAFFVMPYKIFPPEWTLDNFINLFNKDFGGYGFIHYVLNMFIVPFAVSLLVAVVCAVSAFGVGRYNYKGQKLLYAIIILSFILVPCVLLPDFSNTLLVNNLIPLSFYAAFVSAAPLAGLVYIKHVIEKAKQYNKNIIKSVILNSIPMVLITYVFSFLNPFVHIMTFCMLGFTVQFFFLFTSGIESTGGNCAATIIFVAVVFVFFIAAACSSLLFFPKPNKKTVK